MEAGFYLRDAIMVSNNVNPVKTFLSYIYPSLDCRVALCLIPPDDQAVQHRFCTPKTIDKFLPYCRFRNARNWNIYITPSILKPCLLSRRKESFLDYQSIIYLDCDCPSGIDEIRSRYPFPTLVVKTSQGRYQVYWRLAESISVQEQECLMRLMAIDVRADRVATDVSRVLRLPSFWNRKPDRMPCTVDIVFKRNHAVSYKSLLSSVSEDLRSEMVSPHKTCTEGGGLRVLALSSRIIDSGRLSDSEKDWSSVNRWISAGECIEVIIDRLTVKAQRKRDPRYYALLTVKNALKEKGDQRHNWINPRLRLFKKLSQGGSDEIC